jgi:hypothetical protein
MFPRPSAAVLQSSILGWIGLAGLGCGGASELCVKDQDCPSHFCQADGTCGPSDGLDSGPKSDASTGADTTGGGGDSGTCMPTHDGTITGAEMPLVAGRSATFLTATNATGVDTAGSAGSDGTWSWDLSGQLSGDADVVVTLLSPGGTGSYRRIAAAAPS